jgi:hypothetical protein
MTRTQTISAAAPSASDAQEAQAPVTLSFPTAEYNTTTGAPTLLNGACTISASATTTGGTQSATNSQSLTLANPDAVIVKTSLNGKSASDVNGLPWKSGDATVSALPVIYQPGRTVASVQITLPQATNPTQLVPASTTGATTATWTNTSSSSVTNRIGQKTMFNVGPNTFPVGVHPTVLVIDSNGNDIDLSNNQVNPTAESDVRIDNQSPAQPTTFQVPLRQQQWVNAAYTFAGVGGAQGDTLAKYMSSGDAGVGNVPSITNGIDSQNTLTWFAAPTASFTHLTNGTGTGSSCSTDGLTQITTGNDLAATATNTAYSIRALETDKLGNVRCQDLGVAAVGQLATQANFGVDKVAPTAAFVEPATDATAAADHGTYAIGNATPNFKLAISDDASGVGLFPASTKLTRLTPAGTKCLIGTGSSCNPKDTVSSVPADVTVPGTYGYYTYTATVNDLARNAAPTLTRTIAIDRNKPVMGGIAVPAAITGGTSVSFATSATDSLDLASTNYTLSYSITPANGGAPFNIRATGPTLGTPFSGTLTPSASFSLAVPFFIRNVAATDGAGNVANGVGAGLPTQIAARAIDAVGNVSDPGVAAIAPANVPQNGVVNFSTQASGATFQTFAVTNAATNVSNCPASGCTGGASPANATSVSLSASATGTESTTFQFANPFTQVQFYYLDPTTSEWTFIGATSAASVTDDGTATHRTFTWSLSWDPAAGLPAGAIQVIAVGVNAAGDALSSAANGNITLTNP